ncbi:MAG: fibronectin type III domain-containing protein [Patescibacteria group bacterium]
MARKLLVVVILLFCFLLGSTSLNKGDAISCKNERPQTAPFLLSAQAKDRSVVLTWQEAADPVTHYLVAYSRNEIDLEFGNPNVGPKGTTTYTVTELTNGVKYYFKVRGENGCKPGKFSNKLSATAGYPNGITTSRQPNLSIYKIVEGATDSAELENVEDEKAPPPAPLTTIEGQSLNCTSCVGLKMLCIELLLLISFFYFANKFKMVKRIYSILIPLFLYLIFQRINGTCPNDNFWCEYFPQLNVILFMAFIIIYKNKYLNLKFTFIENFLKKKKNNENKITVKTIKKIKKGKEK